jgi:hypothetical protein
MPDQAHPWPQTVEEAVDQLMAKLTDEHKATIRMISESARFDLHFSLGAAIQYSFGLWQGNRTLLNACSTGGYGMGDPVGASSVILQALWQRLQIPG